MDIETRPPPRRSPAYSPSSPAARESLHLHSLIGDGTPERYELLLGEVSRPPLRHLTSRPPYSAALAST